MLPTVILIIRSGALSGQTITVAGSRSPFVIGRAPECDLVLTDYRHVSRRHARLEWRGDTLFVFDENSTNGVVVDGHKVVQARLDNGNHLDLGDFSATVQVSAEASAPDQQKPSSLSAWWRALPGTPTQRWGVLGSAGILLLLGLVGLQGRPTSTPFDVPRENSPSVAPTVFPDPTNVPMGTPTSAPISPTQSSGFALENGRISPDAVQNAKAATVLIANEDGGNVSMGSGFAWGDASRIVTNRHVVVDARGYTQDCLVIFDAGTPRQRKIHVSAQNIRLAPPSSSGSGFEDDLALLQLEAAYSPALVVGSSEALNETEEVYAVGFPLGVGTLTLDGTLPSASIKATRVERLQIGTGGTVSVIQLGGSVTHGNSGGPVVNVRGEVVGVVAAGVEGTGMSYAIPMTFVNALTSD